MMEDMLKNGVNPPNLLNGKAPTGIALTLITPDSERTFAVNLGCAIELLPEDINAEMFEGYNIFHIEGFLVQNKELLEKAVRLAKKRQVQRSRLILQALMWLKRTLFSEKYR